jgi:subtilisin family serine protease
MRRVTNRIFAVTVAVALVLGVSAPAAANVEARVSAHTPAKATGVIVTWKSGSEKSVRTAIAAKGLRVSRSLYGNHGAVVEVPESIDADSLRLSLASVPGVSIAAEERQIIRPLWTPNDPRYSSQWAYSRIQGESAWDIERGQSFVTVGIIDTGVDLAHPELTPALDLTRDYDFVNGDDEANDQNGHGTHVAGIVAAASDNSTGVAGTASGVRVVPIKVIGRYTGSNTDFIDGLYYAADLGVDVVNMSLGTTASDLGASGIALMQQAVDYAYSKGVVLVGAAGNDGDPAVYYPAACNHVIAVSATGPTDVMATYSNYGSAIDIAAPGGGSTSSTGIYSTYTTAGLHTYSYMNGTSMASPFVAATAALLISHVPAATNAEVESALLSSARDLGDVGWDSKYGYGLLQMRGALDALDAPSPSVSRVSGTDRYGTAIAQSASGFESGTVTTTVLASGEDFPDALSGGLLAGLYDSPILLTRRTSLPTGVLTEIARLGASKVIIIGGPESVDPSIVNSLTTAGLTVQRIAGVDRYATAAAVALEYKRITGLGAIPKAFLARGDIYPDALAVSSLSAAAGIPVLLTRTATLSGSTRSTLTSLGTTEVVIAGSSSAVSVAVASEVEALPGVSIVRWQGVDRYGTAAQVAAGGFARGWVSGSYFGIATGKNFPDALGGGALAGHNGGVVLLTVPESLPTATRVVVQNFGYDGTPVVLFGSTTAISQAVAGELMRIRY